MIFADDDGLGEALARQLEKDGDYCHVLLLKDVIKRIENEPDRTLFDLIDKLLKEIDSPLFGIIHLWSLSIPPQSSDVFDTDDV